MPSYWEEDLAILSAENVHFSVETAGLGSRFAASFVDLTLQLLVFTLALLALVGVEAYLVPISSLPKWMVNVGLALGILFTFLLWFGYYFFFEWLWDGQTPGKKRFGLRVMMTDGMPLTVWAALIRNVVRIADMLPVMYGFGTAVALLSPMNQRAGDLVAGTIVSKERIRYKEKKPLTLNDAVDLFLSTATTVPGTQTSAPVPDGDPLAVQLATRVDPEAAAMALLLDREDYELTRDFLLRKEQVPLEARRRLSRSLALRLAAKLKQEAPAEPEEWLQDVVSTLSRAYGH